MPWGGGSRGAAAEPCLCPGRGAGVSCRPWRGGAPARSPVEPQPHLLFPPHGWSFWIRAGSGSTLSFCLQSICCVPQRGRELLGSSPPLGSTIRAALAALEPGVSAHQGPGCFRHPICEMGPWLPLLCWGRVWGAQVGAPAHACVRGLTFLTVLGSSHLGVSSWRRAGEREPSKAQRSLVPDPGHWDQPEGRRVCRWSAAAAWFLAGWAARRVLDTADRELAARLTAASEAEGSLLCSRGLGPHRGAGSSALILTSTSCAHPAGSTDAFEAISTPGEDLPSQTKLQPGPQEPGPDWALTWKGSLDMSSGYFHLPPTRPHPTATLLKLQWARCPPPWPALMNTFLPDARIFLL